MIENAKPPRINDKVFITKFTLGVIILAVLITLLLNLTKHLSVIQHLMHTLDERSLSLVNTQMDLGMREKAIEQMIQRSENLSKVASQDEMQKAHKFEVLKMIHVVRNDLRYSSDISNLKRLNEYVSDKLLKDFLSEQVHIQSDNEIKQYISSSRDDQHKQPPSEIQNLFTKLIRIQSITEFEQRSKHKSDLNNLINSIDTNHLKNAQQIINDMDINDVSKIKEILGQRLKLESILSLIEDKVIND